MTLEGRVWEGTAVYYNVHNWELLSRNHKSEGGGGGGGSAQYKKAKSSF